VKNVIVEGGAAVGVRLKDGSELRAPVIISNADIKATVTDLVGPEHFSKEYVEGITKLTYADSCIMFKIGLKEKITDDQLRMYMPDDRTTMNKASDKQKPEAVPAKLPGMIVVPTNFDASLGPDDDKQLIC
jgi:phytoene dehydrogenase-like protein